jgi:hypothetical protein
MIHFSRVSSQARASVNTKIALEVFNCWLVSILVRVGAKVDEVNGNEC